MISRRKFLKRVAISGTLAGTLPFAPSLYRKLFDFSPPIYPGEILGSSSKIGHRLRSGDFPPPSRTIKTGIAIIGGGVAGLSAAWKLQKLGFTDFRLFELEKDVGGNSRHGNNEISPYPWGAHYIPIPDPIENPVIDLFVDLGIIEGFDSHQLPIYNEYFLCADPQERLLIHGTWQEGLIPYIGTSSLDRKQYQEFFSEMNQLKFARGNDGRPAFSIPVNLSSRDPQFLKLDRISFAQYLDQHDWDSAYLRWYLNYCCLDDYGCKLENVSAWAGIHYFASRRGRASNADAQTVLTWPEGNGWIVKKLHEKLQSQIQCNSLVTRIENHQNEVWVDYLDLSTEKSVRVIAKSAIFASPRYLATRLIPELKTDKNNYIKDFSYSPWLVANVSLEQLPPSKGAQPSWDNVSFNSKSLGYILATHQSLIARPQKTVITYYLPLVDQDPVSARKEAQNKTHQEWSKQIVHDLKKMHPSIEKEISQIDLWVWGHAMIRPIPGFIWGNSRINAQSPLRRIHFAHSDMSGISIFEEAHYHGLQAAKAAYHDYVHS